MSKYTSCIRNVGVVSHGGAGKTSLVEAVLFNAGVVNRLGKVDNETSILDYDPDEIKRKITISSSIARYEWGGCTVNIVAPGV